MYSEEFNQSKILQWSLGALIFVYYIVFSSWIGSLKITKAALSSLEYVCPPYFQSCEAFYFLDALPFGYSQSILYMSFFALLAWCVYLMSKQAWGAVQLSLLPIFLWHTTVTLLMSDSRAGNYEYYLIAFAVILLLFPRKEFFLKLIVVFFYVLSTMAKIHPSWIEGSYFTTLRTGLPFFPDWSTPIITNFVILMEMVGAWFLMSKNIFLQRSVFIFFVFFHLYSGILVMFRYPATVLPFVLILFGPWYKYTPVPLDKKSLFGWSFIILLLCLQVSPKLISGDEKLTMEGNKYGLYMFEANHQCFSESLTHFKNGTSETKIQTSHIARDRCQAYEFWFPLKKKCEANQEIVSTEWKFAHSINGGPFYQIVKVDDACSLEYSASKHNDWIQTEETAPVLGYPVKNIYQ